ncbi:MAG: DUF5696 domain-containing protein [Bacteroidaceae bacterium]|nr:DUF5696 domain-containing protein [Bacteroidaceae bacterium]
MRKIKSFLRQGIVLGLAAIVFCFSASAQKAEPQLKKAIDITVVSDTEIETQDFSLMADKTAGSIILKDKRTGACWYSNPTDGDLQTNMKGINKMQMESQLIVNYLINGKTSKQATSFASSTEKEGIMLSVDSNGIKITYNFISEKFEIPVLYSLDEYGLVASVLSNEIVESGENEITEISLLPYFGASGVNDKGYFLVPDGSGSLINFNNGKTGSSYQQKIYDTDGLMNSDTNIVKVEIAKLPVFGIEKNGCTLLSVIQTGASSCKLMSYVSGTNGNYNYIYPQFTYRQSAAYKMLSKTWYPIEINFVSPLSVKENFTVRYSPVVKKYGGYSDMADCYRNMLDIKDAMGNKSIDNVPLYLDLYGSAKVSDNILGFPVMVNRSLTSFDDAENLLYQLLNNGVDSMKVRYLGTSSMGITNIKVPTSFEPTSAMGGIKGFNKLVEFADKNNIEIYPDNDFIFFRKPTFSLIKQMDATKDVCNKIGSFYQYETSNGKVKYNSVNRYALQPAKVECAADKYLKSYAKLNNKYISMSTLGSFIYSDFGNEICLSNSTAEKFTGILQNYNENNFNIMLEAPNAYALPYADSVIAAPTSSSCFDLEDETVPFYQMIMHGSVSYSVPSVNLSDSDVEVLKAIETGSGLMYSLSNADYSVLCYDDYDKLYSVTANNWIDEISENYLKVKQALSSVTDKLMVFHENVSSGVSRTVYENGVEIFVNYNDFSVDLSGTKLEAKSYLIKQGESK